MKYDMMKRSVVTRVMDAFYGYSECVNKEYEGFRKENIYWYSDRDRFVGRFFKKYIGKYICLMDFEVFAYKYNNVFYTENPESVYSASRNERYNQGEPMTRAVKKYLHIGGFRAVNEMYGHGYIEMACTDTFNNSFNVRIDQENLCSLQFKEITADEFESIAKMFSDDRDDIPFNVTRYLNYDEMKKRKIKGKDIVKETVIVMAKDREMAAKMVTNAVEAEPI